jgi:Zn-dependent metalloprotease
MRAHDDESAVRKRRFCAKLQSAQILHLRADLCAAPTVDDNGGVHINSGTPNKAFYLAAIGIDGYAGEKAGPIWYAALRDPRLKPDASFVQFARLTVINADILFPEDQERRSVRDAWEQVGVVIRK